MVSRSVDGNRIQEEEKGEGDNNVCSVEGEWWSEGGLEEKDMRIPSFIRGLEENRVKCQYFSARCDVQCTNPACL